MLSYVNRCEDNSNSLATTLVLELLDHPYLIVLIFVFKNIVVRIRNDSETGTHKDLSFRHICFLKKKKLSLFKKAHRPTLTKKKKKKKKKKVNPL